MNIPQLSIDLVNQLRSWFYARDRAIVIDRSIMAYNVPAGATMAMAMIEERILTASATGITFSSVPQNFRSLVLVCQLRSDRAAETDGAMIQFNGDTGANYDYLISRTNSGGSTVVPSRANTMMQVAQVEGASSRASNWSGFRVEIPGYTLTDREKWVICSNSGAFGNVSADADLFLDSVRGRWRSTAAIAAIKMMPNVGTNFVAGSRVVLYGLL